MGFLEAQIASRGNAFAAGGSTTGASGVGASPADPLDNSPVLAMLERLARSHEEFREEITDLQRTLNVSLDPRKAKAAIDVATQVKSGGGVR